MGGPGSGWYCRGHARPTTDDHHSIDIRRWKREGLLEPRQKFGLQWQTADGKVDASVTVRTGPDRVILSYRYRRAGEREWRKARYPVLLDWTACHLGGRRPWFLCPGCGRRVAILYLWHPFMCRQCLLLAYPSQRESRAERMWRRVDRLRRRLGWPRDGFTSSGPRPKGMHRKTFARLCAQHEVAEEALLLEVIARFRPLPPEDGSEA